MRKRICILFISVIFCFCGCNTNTDVNTENTEQTSTVDTEKQEEFADTENVAVNGSTSSSRISYAGSEYEWRNITVIIPEEWDGKYVIKESEDDLAFFQKASNDKDNTMGWLCTISIRNEYYNDLPGTTLIAYAQSGVFYYLSMPTDVTFFAEDEAIASEYMSMAAQCEWIAGSMTSTDELYYDANQYVLLTSSMFSLEQHHLLNLSNNSLWIARNEIYARHGKIFQNEYLNNYFNACSWYKPIEGKTEVPESELSQIEKDNIEMILEAERVFAEEHPYPQQYKTNTAIVKRLQGDEISFDIVYETSVDENLDHYTSILKINGNTFDLYEYVNMVDPVQDVFYITDIAEDSSDMSDYNDGLEIAILDNGPSDDPVTHFFKYNGTLVYIGYVPGFPFKDYGNGIANTDKMNGLDGFTHQNGIYGTTTTDLIETAYIDDYYWYDRNNWEMKSMEVGLHNYKWQKPHELYVELPVYYSMDAHAPVIIMQPQKEVYFIKTDNKEWIFIRSKDGVEGYIQVKEGQILNIGLPAEEVFSDLHFFG